MKLDFSLAALLLARFRSRFSDVRRDSSSFFSRRRASFSWARTSACWYLRSLAASRSLNSWRLRSTIAFWAAGSTLAGFERDRLRRALSSDDLPARITISEGVPVSALKRSEDGVPGRFVCEGLVKRAAEPVRM